MANRSKRNQFKKFSRKRKLFLVNRSLAARRARVLAAEGSSTGAPPGEATPGGSGGDLIGCNETQGASDASNVEVQLPCNSEHCETKDAIYIKIEVDMSLPSKSKRRREEKQPEKDAATELSESIQTGICRCCLSEVSFKALQYGNTGGELTDTYADMLLNTFGITVTRGQEHSVSPVVLICSECKARLQSAFAFKQQILKADESFFEYIKNRSFNVDAVKTENASDVANSSRKVKEKICGGEAVNVIIVRKDVPTSKPKPTVRGKKQKKKPAAVSKDVVPEVETKPAGIKCDICNKMEDNCLMMSYHVNRDHRQCGKCSKMLRNKYEKIEHERTHPLDCDLCGEKFETDLRLRSHMVRLHGATQLFTCPSCRTLCDSRARWHEHRIRVHGAPEWRCGACDRLFDEKRHLSMHHRAHHMMERNYPCTKCDYKGANAHRLRRHMVCHSDVKSFQCQYCQKSFARRSTLLFHERIHTGDKRQVCRLCGAAFVQRASLKYHLEKQHPGQF